MKVSNNNPKNLSNSNLSKTSGASPAAEQIGKSAKGLSSDQIQGSVQVDLSPRAKDIQKAKELARPSDSIDEAKVARLQKMIDDGKYNVNAADIADKLVDEHLLMPS